MTLVAGARGGSLDVALLAAARAGDENAFRRLTEPFLRELHVHCYRMLGSLHDAEDALQETLLRAWRHLVTFEAHSSFRAWLYRITTNVCLTATTRRRDALAPPAPPLQPPPGETEEVIHLAPYPDALLGELESTANPAARYDLRESIQLAFLAAISSCPLASVRC